MNKIDFVKFINQCVFALLYHIFYILVKDFRVNKKMTFKEIIQEAYSGYSGYLLQNTNSLFDLIPPRYPKKIAHHITHKFPAKKYELPPQINSAYIIAEYWDDEMGVQAVEVALNGNNIRPDGKKYHITWSLNPEKGAKPVMSNKLLFMSTSQKRSIDPPIVISVEPKFFEN